MNESRVIDADVDRRLGGTPLVVLLDVDGTLAPIAPRPEDAVVPAETRAVVRALTSHPGVHVALVSGRAAEDAERMAGADGVWVIGNHGIEVHSPDGQRSADERVASYRPAIEEAVRRVGALAREMPGVIVEDKRWTLTAHYRLASREDVPRLAAAVDAIAGQLGLHVTAGKEVLELRPPVQVNKGTAVVSLAERLGGFDDGASVLCIGDDVTDEDAFRALRARSPRCVTVRVAGEGGVVETSAELTVDGTDAVRALLERVLELRAAL